MAALAIDTQPAGPVRPVSEVSEEFVRDTLTHLRSVMLSSKEALTPKQILYDYIYFVGEPVPFAQMGFRYLSFMAIMGQLDIARLLGYFELHR